MTDIDPVTRDKARTPATLSAGLAFSDRMEALLDGRVAPDGFGLNITCRPPQVLFRNVLGDRTFDICEFSLGSHIAAVAAGERHYVGLPIFLSRAFRHGNLYVRNDRGIATPQDLIGRRIGITDFHQTAAIWLRGILADEYGVPRTAVTWITGGLASPVLEDRAHLDLPAGICVQRTARTLNSLLDAGELDGLISPVAPPLFIQGDPRIRRLWPDYRHEEQAFFRRTGIFSIMHLLVVKRDRLDAAPWLANAITTTFDRAREMACAEILSRDYAKIATPWLMADRAHTLAELGDDPWTYGLADNRPALEAILGFAELDGITQHRLAPENLFAPVSSAS